MTPTAKPPPAMPMPIPRIGAVASAILLAWLTYRLVERPLRFGARGRIVTVSLALLMLAMGFLGYNTFVREGLEFRNKVFQQNKGQIKYQESFYENDICRKMHPDFKGFYCFVSEAGAPKVQGAGVGRTFTVRKVSFGVGVERTFPLHSPVFEKIEVVTRGDVRRAKLYYLRNLRGKAAKIKERREG